MTRLGPVPLSQVRRSKWWFRYRMVFPLRSRGHNGASSLRISWMRLIPHTLFSSPGVLYVGLSWFSERPSISWLLRLVEDECPHHYNRSRLQGGWPTRVSPPFAMLSWILESEEPIGALVVGLRSFVCLWELVCDLSKVNCPGRGLRGGCIASSASRTVFLTYIINWGNSPLHLINP